MTQLATENTRTSNSKHNESQPTSENSDIRTRTDSNLKDPNTIAVNVLMSLSYSGLTNNEGNGMLVRFNEKTGLAEISLPLGSIPANLDPKNIDYELLTSIVASALEETNLRNHSDPRMPMVTVDPKTNRVTISIFVAPPSPTSDAIIVQKLND